MSSIHRGERQASNGSVAPLYERLPHGPHRLDQKEVVRHQRARMHGAMIEAVAASGYERTSVKQVVGLAGVSRRSFYEQFANKQECFLATFDLIATRGARRISEAYRATEGDLEERLTAAFREFADAVKANWKGASLVIVEAQTAGAPGLVRLRRATATFERMIASSFERAPGASPLPRPVVRGIAGGLHAAMSTCVREGSNAELSALGEEMLRWTLLFQTPAAERMAERLAERVRTRLLNGQRASNGGAHRGGGVAGRDERERLLCHALRLAVVEDYRTLSAAQIAQEAGVPTDVFFELFKDRDECFLAALDMLGEELVGRVADPDLVSSDWPRAVRGAIAELMRYLAEHPLYARTIAAEAFAAGPVAIERNLALAREIATLLTEGAPGNARSTLAVEGVAGAIWHTVRCQVASDQIQLLAALADHLAYVVLTPFIGAKDATAIVTEEERPSVACRSVARRSG
jgi:TetR/AcrR family transcriptional regulator